jgi:hypothetical protein
LLYRQAGRASVGCVVRFHNYRIQVTAIKVDKNKLRERVGVAIMLATAQYEACKEGYYGNGLFHEIVLGNQMQILCQIYFGVVF